MVQYKDFDEALKNREPVRFVMRERPYELPLDVPAKAMLEMLRAIEDAPPGKDVDVGINFLGVVVGKENLDEMIDNGATITQLLALATWVSEVYVAKLGEADAAEADGEAATQGNP